MGEKEFTHLTETGVHMVEVGAKPQQRRTAVASGKIHLQKETIDMIKNHKAAVNVASVLVLFLSELINAVTLADTENTKSLSRSNRGKCSHFSVSLVELHKFVDIYVTYAVAVGKHKRVVSDVILYALDAATSHSI